MYDMKMAEIFGFVEKQAQWGNDQQLHFSTEMAKNGFNVWDMDMIDYYKGYFLQMADLKMSIDIDHVKTVNDVITYVVLFTNVLYEKIGKGNANLQECKGIKKALHDIETFVNEL